MGRTSTWKNTERSFAKMVGGERNHFEQEDIRHPIFSIECKHRSPKGYPTTVRKWFDQAVAGAGEGKIPLLAIHQSGERHAFDLIVIRRSDFEALYGSLKAGSASQDGDCEVLDPLGDPEPSGSQ